MSVDPREAARFGFFDDEPVLVSPQNTQVIDLREPQNVRTSSSDPLAATSYSSPMSTSARPVVNRTPDISEDATPAPINHVAQPTAAVDPAPAPAVDTVITPHPEPTGTATQTNPPGETPKDQTDTMTDPETAKSPVNAHARRRMGVYGAVAALLFAVVTGNTNVSLTNLSAQVSAQSATPMVPDENTSAAAAQLLQSGLDAAREHRAATGSYRGTAFPTGIMSVTGSNIVVVTAVVNGSCWYTAIVPDYDSSPKWDATAKRCNPDRLAQLQTDVDAGE
jgi:hypothetical protein